MTDLERRDLAEGEYVVAVVHEEGRPAGELLAEALPELISSITFGRSMRWNASGASFSRPIRWFVTLLGETVVPFTNAGLHSGRVTRGLRPYGSPEIEIPEFKPRPQPPCTNPTSDCTCGSTSHMRPYIIIRRTSTDTCTCGSNF